jgi:REP element-mobilizing transposase RayT
MSTQIRKSHNVTNLVYHIVCPIKYRCDIITDKVKYTIFKTCQTISKNHEIYFIEVGTDLNHVHFLIQTVPTYSPTELVKVIKINIARAIFKFNPEVKRFLWGGELWTDGYYMDTVSVKSTEGVIADYVRNQGNNQYDSICIDTVRQS